MDDTDWDRVAGDYYGAILSPLTNSDFNPLFSDLRHLGGNAIDLGCGIGPLLPILSEQFSHVTALDFSKEMVEQARKNNLMLPNVSYVQADMKDLRIRKRFDVAVAVNSILAPDVKEVNSMLKQAHKILKPGGTLLAVLPAMEIYLYQAMLIVDENKDDLKKARKKAAAQVNPDEHDLLLGTITFDGDTQKCFYRFEIPHLLEKAGFKDIDKVLYS